MDAELSDSKRRVVGTKQLLKLMELGQMERIVIARDAQDHIREKLVSSAQAAGVPIVYVDLMQDLGKACEIAVGAAAAGIRKDV